MNFMYNIGIYEYIFYTPLFFQLIYADSGDYYMTFLFRLQNQLYFNCSHHQKYLSHGLRIKTAGIQFRHNSVSTDIRSTNITNDFSFIQNNMHIWWNAVNNRFRID